MNFYTLEIKCYLNICIMELEGETHECLFAAKKKLLWM